MKAVTTCFFFNMQLSCSVPLQPAEPLGLRVWSVCEARHGQGGERRTRRAQQTPSRWHAYTCSDEHPSMHTISFMCLWRADSSILTPKSSKPTIPTLQFPVTPHWFLSLKIPFISITGRRKVPVPDCAWHLDHLAPLTVSTNLSVCQNSCTYHF